MAIYATTVDSGCTATDPYQFKVTGGGLSNQIVNLVMPLGGVESGLYRSPKAGEKVLVTDDGAATNKKCYLMGYLPSTVGTADGIQNFNNITSDIDGNKSEAASDVINGKGEVFRYKTENKILKDNGEYSEIGFYVKPTQWSGDPAAATPPPPPNVDRINIQSMGDIHESAVNHHQIKARRLELVANDDLTKTVDPAAFKHGDINIKAGNNITIEAGGTLTLKVGRSMIVISDTGISITNQLMTSLPNPVDASLSMSVRDGITINGQTIGLNADYKWSISDKFGAGVTGTAGVINIGGRDISINAAQWTATLASNIAYGLDYILKLATGGIAQSFGDPKWDADNKLVNAIFNEIIDETKIISDSLFLFFKYDVVNNAINRYNLGEEGTTAIAYTTGQMSAGNMAFTGTWDATPFNIVSNLLSLTLEITKTVYTTVAMAGNYKGEDLDKFNYSTMVIDNGIILTFTSILVGMAFGINGNAAISLGHSGDVIIKAASEKNLYAASMETAAVMAPLVGKWIMGAATATSVVSEVTKTVKFIVSTIKNFSKLDEGDKEAPL
jgi:hypothetical protein